MSKGYTKAEMFVDEDGGRSLHNDLAKFFSQALYFQTPLRTILKSTELENAIHFQNWTNSELDFLLDSIEEITPCGA